MHGDGEEFLENFEEACSIAGGEIVETTPADWGGKSQMGCRLDPTGDGGIVVHPRRGSDMDFHPGPESHPEGDPGVHFEGGGALGQIPVESFHAVEDMRLELFPGEGTVQFTSNY